MKPQKFTTEGTEKVGPVLTLTPVFPLRSRLEAPTVGCELCG